MVEWMPKKENGSKNISMTRHEMHIAARERDNREILADNLPPTMDRVGLFTFLSVPLCKLPPNLHSGVDILPQLN